MHANDAPKLAEKQIDGLYTWQTWLLSMSRGADETCCWRTHELGAQSS